MEVLYINLARRRDRNERFLKVNASVATFRRIEAVDGNGLQVDQLLKEGVIQEPLWAYTAGALGCALSHKKIWEHCVSTGVATTVAEDDAVFNGHFEERAAEVLRRLPVGWDIILWGWNFDSVLHVEMMEGINQSVMRFDCPMLGSRVSEFQGKNYDVLPLRLIAAFGTVCYSVAPKGAQRLREACFPLTNETIYVPAFRSDILSFNIDASMNKCYRILQAYVAFPPLVWTENDKANSDVNRV